MYVQERSLTSWIAFLRSEKRCLLVALPCQPKVVVYKFEDIAPVDNHQHEVLVLDDRKSVRDNPNIRVEVTTDYKGLRT